MRLLIRAIPPSNFDRRAEELLRKIINLIVETDEPNSTVGIDTDHVEYWQFTGTTPGEPLNVNVDLNLDIDADSVTIRVMDGETQVSGRRFKTTDDSFRTDGYSI